MEKLLSYKYTLIATVIGIVFYTVAALTNINVMENIIKFLGQFGNYSLDELPIVGFIISNGFIIDIIIKRMQKENNLQLNLQKIHVLKSTVRTMQDVVNNLTVAVQYCKLNIEEKNEIETESFELIDDVIKSTAEKMEALANLEEVDVKEIYSGVFVIDYESKKNALSRNYS